MKLPKDIPIFGDVNYRGDCRKEDAEQIEFVDWLKFNYPDYHRVFIHPKNEGNKNYRQINKDLRMGSLNPGASDCVIPGNPTFVIELKQVDHTESTITNKQLDYLRASQKLGCFVGIALGAEALKEAFLLWLDMQNEGK